MRLIDADALSMKLIGEELNAYAKADFRFAQALSIFHGLISKAPTVEERKHGHWKNGCCTVCGESAATDGHFDFIAEEEQKYCWNCGAIMDGKAICDD